MSARRGADRRGPGEPESPAKLREPGGDGEPAESGGAHAVPRQPSPRCVSTSLWSTMPRHAKLVQRPRGTASEVRIPGGVIGNTSDFGSDFPGSSPGRGTTLGGGIER
jgi:hypothetical protein